MKLSLEGSIILVPFVLGALFTCFAVAIDGPWIKHISSFLVQLGVDGQLSYFVSQFIVLFFAILPGFLVIVYISAYYLNTRIIREPHRSEESFCPVSVIIPVAGREEHIVETVDKLLGIGHKDMEILIVLNNADTETKEKTYSIVNEYVRIFELKEASKCKALNLGLEKSSSKIILTIDADTLIGKESFYLLLNEILKDDKIGAVAGNVKIHQPETFVEKLQVWDYLGTISFLKNGQDLGECVNVAQGSFSMYRKQVVELVGGWEGMYGEDIVLTWKILSKGYKVKYVSQAVAFTKAPASLKRLFKQRERWAAGLIDAITCSTLVKKFCFPSSLFAYTALVFIPTDVVISILTIPSLFLWSIGRPIFFGPVIFVYYLVWILLILITFEDERVYLGKYKKSKRFLIFHFIVYPYLISIACTSGYIKRVTRKKILWK